ncbi:hypothetical protein BBJ28_00019551 [Nothophytophthora sp. Chile5]|nr:hypothetical protein BBJ28_00019551 [Nothophytophthora sp. Chile5]
MSELSPLWESEDAPLQLDEALELIDACDLASTLSDIDCGSPRSLALSTNDVTVVSNRRKRGKSDACAAKKRVRNPADDVRRRERRKAERLQLQEQVQEHEARVERLKKASRMAVGSKSDKFDELGAKRERSKWLDAVVEQVEKRRKAEELNAELKTLLVQRLQMTGAISDLLTKEPAHLAAMVKRCTSVLPKPILQGFTGYPGIATELQGTLHRIFDSTDLVLGSATLSSLESISSSSRIKQRDPINGPSIELSTTTPLACELAEANAILWSAIMEKQWPGEQATFKLKMKRCTPRSVELRFTMGFDDPQYDWVRLNGVTLLEKHDEDHRITSTCDTLKMDEVLEFPESEEAQALLAEALELIDSCDVVADFSDVGCASPQRQACSVPAAVKTTSREPDAGSVQGAVQKKKRVRDPAIDCRRRARRKAERELLHNEVQECEALVERLQQRRNSFRHEEGGKQEPSPWLDAMIKQAMSRRKAEELNSELKTLLAGQRKATEAINDLLKQEPALLEVQASTTHSSLAVELKSTLHQLFASAKSVFENDTLVSWGSISSSTRIDHQRSNNGPCVELSTTTPLTCSKTEASAILWDAIKEIQWPREQTAFNLKEKELTPRTVELGYTIGFDDTDEFIRLNGVSMLEKSEDVDRDLLVWSSLVAQPGGRLRFRAQGWIMVARSPTNPLQASVLRTCCRLTAERAEAGVATSEGDLICGSQQTTDGTLRSAMIRDMSRRMKARIDEARQKLLERTGAADAASLIMI